MKKHFYLLYAFALVCISCNKETPAGTSGSSQITINAEKSIVKTALGGNKSDGFTASWTAGDKLQVFRTTATGTQNAASGALSADGPTASFPVDFETCAGEQTFTAVYPSSAVAQEGKIWGITFPKEQTSTGGNWDKAADLLIAGPVVKSEQPSSLEMAFCRLGSVIRIEVQGMETGENIQNIVISSDGTRLCGTYSFNPASGEAEIRTESKSAVTVYCPGETVACARVFSGTHAGLNFTVNTDRRSYNKSYTTQLVLDDNTVNCFTLTVDPSSAMEGTGTELDPYIIKTVAELKGVSSRLILDSTIYFKLNNDIDLSGEANWDPYNPTANNMRIDFDGQGHTISNLSCNGKKYASFFGLLSGKARNINFDSCTVTAAAGGLAGVITGWAGISTSIFDAEIYNCHVTNSKVTAPATNASATFIGGILARAGNATIKVCSFQGDVINTSTALESYTGGICGQPWDKVTINNVQFNGTVSSAKTRNVGGVFGYSGYAPKVDSAAVKGTITCGYDRCGGIAAYSQGGTFNRCYVTADINVGKNASSNYSYCGGILGFCDSNANPSITNCSYSGKIVAKSNVVGGICGQVSKSGATTTIKNCQTSGSITGVEFLAGVLGYCQKGNLIMSNCKSAISVTGTSNEIGGMVAYTANSSTSTITGCQQTGNLTGLDYVGGIIGRLNTHTATISKCSVNCALKGKNYVGGIVGGCNTSDGKSLAYISDCCAAGSVYGSTSFVGGIFGEMAKNCTIANCYATNTVTAPYAVGGIVGRNSNRTNTGTNMSQNFGTSVTGCIAWNPTITSNKSGYIDPNSNYSVGAVVGFSTLLNTMSNCWRRTDMVMTAYANTELNALFDHEDVSSTAPLTEPYTYTYFYPYHGKAATAGETLSDVAERIGWSSTIWDFTGSEPKLK